MLNTLPNLLRNLFHLVIPVCSQYFQLWYVTASKVYYHKKHLKHLTTNALSETNKADFGPTTDFQKELFLPESSIMLRNNVTHNLCSPLTYVNWKPCTRNYWNWTTFRNLPTSYFSLIDYKVSLPSLQRKIPSGNNTLCFSGETDDLLKDRISSIDQSWLIKDILEVAVPTCQNMPEVSNSFEEKFPQNCENFLVFVPCLLMELINVKEV